ncbi:SecDF P1 head subdomain-containing protein [Psychroserpens sp.]|uniref:SecDF P1 head subdomain-containing protein n=1 Tax=Psychroserpens sp. TaxID=2020870 RepID=UPI00385D2C8E
MMKNVLILFFLGILFSCGNIAPKHEYNIIYEFENDDNISVSKKQSTVEVLKRRIDKFASNYDVKLNDKQQIEIILSTDFKLNVVNAIVTNPGKLEFWECIKVEQLDYSFFSSLSEMMQERNELSSNILDKFSPPVSGGLLSVDIKDAEKIKDMLKRKEVLELLPHDIRKSKFLFGNAYNGKADLYLVKLPPSGNAFLNETHITDARQNYSSTGRPTVSMQMNEIGAQRWERMTQIAFQERSQIAVTLNDIVYSAPTASNGAILGGNTEISGNFTVNEAQDLALILSSRQRIPKLKFVNSLAIVDE